MGSISEAQREEIRQRVPLEELLPDYNVHLVPAGRELKALCPFHQEKTPSFHVDPEKQFYYCHGCHAGGDVFRFVEEMDRVSWREAVEILARRAGVVIREEHGRGEAGGRVLDLYDVLEFTTSFYHRVLNESPEGEGARAYLRRRGIEEGMWKRFRLGYSPPAGDRLLREAVGRSLRPAALERAGLARAREASRGGGYYDYFRGRVMFPIGDAQGRTIGFGARTLGDDEPKYLNTAKTRLFDKSSVLYGLAQAKGAIRREGRISIVEGYTDVIVAHQAGLETFVASLGTAFTAENARQLRRLAPRVSLIFDGDNAGQGATERSLDLLVTEGVDVSIHTVTGGKDPCEAILALGAEEFHRRLEADAVDLFEFKWRRTVGSLRPGADAVERGRAVDEFLVLIGRIPSGVTRRLVLREYWERIGAKEAELVARLEEIRRRGPGVRRKRFPEGPASRGAAAGEAGAEARRPALSDLACLVLECMIALPERAASIWQKVDRRLFGGETGRVIAAGIDRRLESGEFSGLGLARAVEEGEAHRVVVERIRRVEGDEERRTGEDWEFVWSNCRRELRRRQIREIVGELDQKLSDASRSGDRENADAFRRERNQLLRELKR